MLYDPPAGAVLTGALVVLHLLWVLGYCRTNRLGLAAASVLLAVLWLAPVLLLLDCLAR